MSYQIVSDKQVPVKGDARKARVIIRLPDDIGEPDAFSEETAWSRWHRTRIAQLRADVLLPIAAKYSLALEAKHTVTKSKKAEANGQTFDVGSGWVDWLLKLGQGRYAGGFILPVDSKFDVDVTATGGVSVARSAVIVADKVRKEYVAYQTTPELGSTLTPSEPRVEVCSAKRFTEVKFRLIGEFHYPSNEVYYADEASKPVPATLEPKAVAKAVAPQPVKLTAKKLMVKK